MLRVDNGFVTRTVVSKVEALDIASRIAESTIDVHRADRPSSFAHHSADHKADNGDDETKNDDLRRKTGDLSIYKYYLASSGVRGVGGYLIAMSIWMFFTEFSSKQSL